MTVSGALMHGSMHKSMHGIQGIEEFWAIRSPTRLVVNRISNRFIIVEENFSPEFIRKKMDHCILSGLRSWVWILLLNIQSTLNLSSGEYRCS